MNVDLVKVVTDNPEAVGVSGVTGFSLALWLRKLLSRNNLDVIQMGALATTIELLRAELEEERKTRMSERDSWLKTEETLRKQLAEVKDQLSTTQEELRIARGDMKEVMHKLETLQTSKD